MSRRRSSSEAMITLSKPISSGQAQAYHKEEFANARENYYTEGERVRGEWHSHRFFSSAGAGWTDRSIENRLSRNDQTPDGPLHPMPERPLCDALAETFNIRSGPTSSGRFLPLSANLFADLVQLRSLHGEPILLIVVSGCHFFLLILTVGFFGDSMSRYF